MIGSSCIGASVTGGICNNSGGSLIRRGPAFTQFSLFACIDADGQLRLVNHLGMALGDDPEQILANLESGRFARDDLPAEPGRMASDREYRDCYEIWGLIIVSGWLGPGSNRRPNDFQSFARTN